LFISRVQKTLLLRLPRLTELVEREEERKRYPQNKTGFYLEGITFCGQHAEGRGGYDGANEGAARLGGQKKVAVVTRARSRKRYPQFESC